MACFRKSAMFLSAAAIAACIPATIGLAQTAAANGKLLN
jgi:hypothetical protein